MEAPRRWGTSLVAFFWSAAAIATTVSGALPPLSLKGAAPVVECPSCDDGDPCTVDQCDPVTGACAHDPVICDDGSQCTEDFCDPLSGSCASRPLVCDDGTDCTVDECIEDQGCVFHSQIGADCNDGNACTEVDTTSCDGGRLVCLGHPISCDDDSVCTNDSCDPVLGCVFTPFSCNDGNPCTIDRCDVYTGCDNNTVVVGPCDDGDPCTFGGTCGFDEQFQIWTCLATHVCDDGNPCTSESCDLGTGACFYTNNTAPCEDGNPCTREDVCRDGVCQGGVARTCNDGVGCTIDSCDPAQGCVHQPDDSLCGVGGVCFEWVCEPGRGCTQSSVDCSDSDQCTVDACFFTRGCTHAARSCDDGNSCTIDSCEPDAGCKHVTNPDLPDSDEDGLGDPCDNCPVANNPDQVDCDDNGLGDVCDEELRLPLQISFESSLRRGSGTLTWGTKCEAILEGFNVVVLTALGDRVQLNPDLIPCEECTTRRGHDYEFIVSRHRGARRIFLEMVFRTGQTLSIGPPERVSP